MSSYEAEFQKLKEAGINSVVALMKILVDAKIIDDAAETKQKVEKLFQDVTDKSNVQLDKFVQVMTAIAQDKQINTEQVVTQLVNTLSAGVAAIVQAVESVKDTPTTTRKPPAKK